MRNRRFSWRSAAVPLVSALALVASGTWLLVNQGSPAPWTPSSRDVGAVYGPMMGDPGMMGGSGMMGDGWHGSGMMNGTWATGGAGIAGDGQPVRDLDAARERAQVFADSLSADLQVGEVMRFSNHFYADVVTASGEGATEVLVDSRTGAVHIEPGPAMMWNTQYGMMAAPSGSGPRLDVEAAEQAAVTWLTNADRDLTVADQELFPGYYTMHTLKDGAVEGMLSVNATTGAVWYHNWHGDFVEMAEAQ